MFEIAINDFIVSVRNSKRVPQPIGRLDDPTYHRWYVWPRNPVFNCYLHNFHHDDEQDPHDHRMLNITFTLQGSYYEERFMRRPRVGRPLPKTFKTLLKQHRILVRLPWTPHRVVLRRDHDDKPIPVWSLFIGFPQFRGWGFWCPNGGAAKWRPQKEYLMRASGATDYAYTSQDAIVGCEG